MDVRKPPISPFTLTDPEATRINSVRDGSSVIYFASAEEVSEGFAIALRAMGFETEIPLSDILPQSDTSTKS